MCKNKEMMLIHLADKCSPLLYINSLGRAMYPRVLVQALGTFPSTNKARQHTNLFYKHFICTKICGGTQFWGCNDKKAEKWIA